MLYIGVMNNTVAVKGVFTISIKKLKQTLIQMYSFQQGECYRSRELYQWSSWKLLMCTAV